MKVTSGLAQNWKLIVSFFINADSFLLVINRCFVLMNTLDLRLNNMMQVTATNQFT